MIRASEGQAADVLRIGERTSPNPVEGRTAADCLFSGPSRHRNRCPTRPWGSRRAGRCSHSLSARRRAHCESDPRAFMKPMTWSMFHVAHTPSHDPIGRLLVPSRRLRYFPIVPSGGRSWTSSPRCRGRGAAADDQHRHRQDHSEQFLKTIKRSGLGKNLFDEMRYRTGRTRSRFRAEQARLSRGEDPRRRRQFRLRLVARARALGAAGFRHPLRHLAQLRRHLLQQLLQERHPADRAAAGGGRQADGRCRARRQRDRDRRSRDPEDHRPRRRPMAFESIRSASAAC